MSKKTTKTDATRTSAARESARQPTLIEQEASALWELLNDKPAKGLKDAVPVAVKDFIQHLVIELSNETQIEYCSHVDIRETLPLMIKILGAEEALSYALSLAVEYIADLAGDEHALYSNMVCSHGRLMAETYMHEREGQDNG
jgi:hypothetical protein